jgi:outer membrane receptor protein involved in Fe transport
MRLPVWLLLSTFPSAAQVGSSTLLGTVSDTTGAMLARAAIEVRHEDNGFSRSTFTAADGSYRIEQLQPGPYSLVASLAGFQKLKLEGLVLEVNQKARVDLELQVGEQTESITVTAKPPLLQTAEAGIGYRLESNGITALPLAERNVISLLTLGPGAIPRHLGGFVHDFISDVQPDRGAVALNPPVNGARSTTNSYLLDGALNTDLTVNAIAVNPPMESVQEFRVQSSLPAAEFQQSGGGVIDVVTKSGGLAYHGSAFEYFRNEALDARNFFDDPSLPRPVFRQNQFGGSLGGPLPLASTFFFVGYEGARGKAAKSSLRIVPDEAMRRGDLRGRPNAILDPLDIDPVTGARRPFPNGIIPAGRIDPIARTFLERFQPLPNRTQGTSNYLDATPNQDADDQVSGRIDREFGSLGRLFGRYTLNSQRARLAGSFPELPTLQRVRAQQAALSHIHAGASWINEARLSFTRLRVFALPESAFREDVAAELGITGIPHDPFTFGLPNFLITNVSTVTDSTIRPQVQRNNLWHVSDAWSLARGRHSLKFGFQWVHFQMNYLQTRMARGQFIFSGVFTGDAFADFLLGFPQITNRTVGHPQAYLRQNTYTGYAQDEIRLGGRLTLNLGLRYEYAAPFREQRGNLLNLDYSTLPAAPLLVRAESAIEPDRNNFAPRVGLAWRPAVARERMVLRAGYGIYFSPEIAVETYDLVRNGVRNESNATSGTRPVLTLRNGFPDTATTGLPGYFGLDRDARTPYVQQWSASVQHELPASIALEIAYAGTKGTRLGLFRQFNTPLHVVTGANLAPRPGTLQLLRPFPALGEIIQRQHISNSSYHSLQVKTEKRMGARLSFLASFVWSKSIDDADSVVPAFFGSVGAQDERNLGLERGLSFFNVGRRVSAGVVYELPGVGLPLPLRRWRFSGIVTLQDGTPVTPFYFALDPANTGTPNRPDIVPGESIRLPRSERTPERFFNTAAFRAPEPFHFGNAGRNIIPGPGNNIFDLAVSRRFAIAERHSVEARAEFFNSFNHPNFGIPGGYPDFGPFFGRIFATGQPRRIQFALRYEF